MNFCRAGIGTLSILLIAGLVTGCNHEAKSAGATASKPTVRVVPVEVRPVTENVYFTGRTEATQSVDIQSRVTGYLNSIEFKPGAEVEEGALLFKIDPRPFEATLDEAKGRISMAEARLKLAVADYDRAINLLKAPLTVAAITQQDVDKFAAMKTSAAADIEVSQASAESAQLNVDFTKITSPIKGRVGRNLITVGNLVKQDSTLLTTVVSEDKMFAYFDVDEHTMLRIRRRIQEGHLPSGKKGEYIPVEMGLADENEKYPHGGKIDFINNRVDANTGTLQVRAEFENPRLGKGEERLLDAGLFVRIRVPLGQPVNSLVVPEAAIGADQGRKYLLVVNAQNIVEYRPVIAGILQPGGLQVVEPVKMSKTPEGLKPKEEGELAKDDDVDSVVAGDRVVVGGLLRVRPGSSVEVQKVTGAGE